jgi:hypothetical protein
MPAVVSNGLLDRNLLLFRTVSLLIDFFKTMLTICSISTIVVFYGTVSFVDDFKEVVCFECGYG